MKYLISFNEDMALASRFQGTQAWMMPEILLTAIEATRPYLDELKKENRVVDWGFYGARHGFYAIVNAKSHAELHEIIELAPLRPYCVIECRPVLEAGEFADVFGKIRKEALATAEKWGKLGSRVLHAARD